MDNQFIHIMQDLRLSLANDEDLTVIIADTFSAVDRADGSEDFTPLRKEYTRSSSIKATRSASPRTNSSVRHASPPMRQSSPPRRSPAVSPSRARAVSPTARAASPPREFQPPSTEKPVPLTREATPPRLLKNTRLVCFANNVFDREESEDGGRMIFSSMSHPFLQKIGSCDVGDTASVGSVGSDLFNGRAPSTPIIAHPSPSEMRAGARAWRERHGHDGSPGIDFRTGMSGHAALFSNHAHPHAFLDENRSMVSESRPLSSIPKMSSHTGLSRPKRGAGILDMMATSLGFSGGSPSSAERRPQTVPQSGSI